MLETLGENVRMARLRRALTTARVAERAGISRKTLWEPSHLFFSVTNWAMDFSYADYFRIASGCIFTLTHYLSNSHS